MLLSLPCSEKAYQNCTVPVSVGPPLCAVVTLAVRVTLEPCWMVGFDVVTVVVVPIKRTVWVVLPEELAKLLSPEYSAVIVWVPPESDDVEICAWLVPETLTGAPSDTPSDRNCTVPVNAGGLGWPVVTSAVNVTLVPRGTEALEDVTIVAVAYKTETFIGAEVDAA